MSAHHDTDGHPGHERAGEAERAMARLLELDAEVLAPHLEALTGLIAQAMGPGAARILDLGSGPGAGSLALARRFPAAQVTAVDISPRLLHRLRWQAAAHGVADRVGTVEADLDGPWTGFTEKGTFDLIWAAAFMHHVSDPARAFARAFEHLRPGGLVAVSEMDFFPCFLPEDTGAGRPGLEARLHHATNTQPPHEWTGALERAGFVVEEHRPFEIRLNTAQAGPALNAYAQVCLAKLRSHATDVLEADDLAALDALLDEAQPQSIARRDDLSVRTTRTAWLARRP
ncbi:class I SAM-dependent methyltransferase [Streptomyces parvulus]|uniref:class I SAM-dependent methyltransferase n=1 Tax=Streptomyces parvulus TaxID=146923 RepID=UPI0034538564